MMPCVALQIQWRAFCHAGWRRVAINADHCPCRRSAMYEAFAAEFAALIVTAPTSRETLRARHSEWRRVASHQLWQAVVCQSRFETEALRRALAM